MERAQRFAPAGPCRVAVVLALGTITMLAWCGTAEGPVAIAPGALVGTWALVSVEERRPNGEIILGMGRQPLGLLIYDRAGNMSVQIMRDPTLPQAPATPEDRYYAYFGRYEVREATVVHRVRGSMRPSEIGVEYVRPVRVSGDRLVLGLTPTRTVTWRRLE